MLKVLFIDDDPERHEYFKRNAKQANSPYGFVSVKHVWTHDDAVEALRTESWDVVYFDFDLNDHPHLNTSYETGMYGRRKLNGEDIAVAMVQLDSSAWPKRCVVHSHNVGGASLISKVLTKAGISHVVKEFSRTTGRDL